MELLPKLRRMQERFGCLPKDELAALARDSGIPLAEVIGTASFYTFFSFSPGGETEHIERLYPCCGAGVLLNGNEDCRWTALGKAEAAPEAIIPLVEGSGLLGRSGGFPVGSKWRSVRNAKADIKYVICNADEGEPGTGKDRVLLERRPNAVIEGMAVCAAAVGAKKGYIYLRGEYSDLRESLEKAVEKAPLGEFEIEIYMGHGAYVCGEETALIASLEGRRGEPALKPPYPVEAGLYGRPTVVNNVETFACVPFLVDFGAELFRRHGTEGYSGSKLFTVFGKVKKPGVYELDSGVTVGGLLRAAGGETERIQAVLTGGGSGSIMGADCMDMPMTVRGCAERGAVFGTASLRFIGESESLVSIVRELMLFFAAESCGMCVPCRVGLRRLGELLEKLESGAAYPEELEEIEALAEHIRANARCGLGQSAVTPVLSLIKNFPEVLK